MPPSKKLKILFVTSEVVPFIKTGGLADVSSALPQKLQELGHQVRIVVPKYGAIDERKYKIHEVVRLKDLTTQIGDKEVVFSLRSSFLIGSKARVQIYFLDNQEYFGSRHSLYSDPLTGEDFPDNDERFILLAKSIFELVIKLGWVPDIIHCNDWQCGLVPVYLKTMFSEHELFQNVKTLFTIHNLSYQGVFPKSSFNKTGLPDSLVKKGNILHNNKFNYLKAGLEYSDYINTVSETYAKEICKDEEIASGLQEVLKSRKDAVHGIVNGIDPLIWNPEKDKKIAKKYSVKNLSDKILNKKALSEKFNFEFKENTPVIGMISRLEDNKGFDLIQKVFKDLMKLDIQFVLLGTGNRKYHMFFEEAYMKYRDKFSCYLGFDDELAHLIEAGSDMFLMPSKFEPCGLNQMYSLIYGTVPIVRETGGLADTVVRFDEKTGEGTGFSFKKYDSNEMMKEINRALSIYKNDNKTWTKIMKAGMKVNFTWLNSSKNYVELYKTILSP
ncbi:MAG: glycogen synthase GlgA [Ignavibacteriae bacterium HGW-Ignavibacteriae-2]|jgi:starch synthase|nr:glycogen synthase GlgA [Bacteroidota bacterium]PKL89412.1 MAG: glycogen synthase GlgA [Ignavibacteriae bacterium HGW-Ignavibacteriae-2]